MIVDELIDGRRRYRRAWVAFGDFMEAGMALNSYLTVRSCFPTEAGGENDLQNTRFCLIGFAIVAYMRPFKLSYKHERATRSVTLEELGMSLDKKQRELHDRIEVLRDKLIAHSDFSHKELVPETPHAARAATAPTITQLKAIEFREFHWLVAHATTSANKYMGRLVVKHGDKLMG